MAEPSSLSTSRRRAPASAAITSVVVVRPRPGRPAAALGAGHSARVMWRLPVLRRPWPALLTSRHRATAAPSPSPSLLRGAPASAATTSVLAIGPRPKWPALTLGAGHSARVMRRLPVLRHHWLALPTLRHRLGRASALAPAGRWPVSRRLWSALLASPLPRLRPRHRRCSRYVRSMQTN